MFMVYALGNVLIVLSRAVQEAEWKRPLSFRLDYALQLFRQVQSVHEVYRCWNCFRVYLRQQSDVGLEGRGRWVVQRNMYLRADPEVAQEALRTGQPMRSTTRMWMRMSRIRVQSALAHWVRCRKLRYG